MVEKFTGTVSLGVSRVHIDFVLSYGTGSSAFDEKESKYLYTVDSEQQTSEINLRRFFTSSNEIQKDGGCNLRAD